MNDAWWASLTKLRKAGRRAELLAALGDALRRDQLEPDELERAGRLLAKELEATTTVRVLGQCTTSWLVPMIAASGFGRGLSLAVSEAAYDNVVQDLSAGAASSAVASGAASSGAASSGAASGAAAAGAAARASTSGAAAASGAGAAVSGAAGGADVVVLVPWSARVLAQTSAVEERIAGELALWQRAWQLATERGARIVQIGYDVVGAGPLGHHLSAASGDVALIRELDRRLREALPAGAYFVDLALASGELGRARFYDARQYHWTKQPFSMAGAAALAHHVVAGIRALLVGPKKVLVVDLDNTLWGGVVGETGPLGVTLGGTPEGEAFQAFQRYVKGLAQRGVLIAVASKNNPADAREPFGAHPDMILALDDIAAFEASWDPKAAALRRIAAALSLGLDSFVFFDDNPAEREHVRQALPEVEVVEVPDEPDAYVRALEAGLWFETVALTDEDRARTSQYAVERRRVELRATSASLDDYLASLAMVAQIRELDGTDLARVVQLIGKTNQWNLTTRRHSEAHVKALAAAGGTLALTVRLRDRFGDHGLVGVVIGVADGDALAIDTWLMSCRVIGRTLEQLVLGEIARRGAAMGYRRIVGEYVPTAKNALVAGLYAELGFTPLGANRHALAVPPASLPRTFVALE